MTDNKKIVVIDDNQSICHIMEAYLSSLGYHVQSFFSAVDVLKRIADLQPDAIFCDLMLGEYSGFDLISSISSENYTLPIIAISGSDDPEDVIRAYRVGAWDYITKPFSSLDEISNVLERVLFKAFTLSSQMRYKTKLEDELQESYQKLKNAYKSVRKQVDDRTTELARSNKRLLAEMDKRKEQLQLLRDREKRFRMLFSNMSSGGIISRYDDKKDLFYVLELNKTAKQILGITEQFSLNQNIVNIFPMSESEKILEMLHNARTSDDPLNFPYMETEDEKIICWYENEIFKLSNSEFVLIFDDVTSQRKAEQEIVFNKNSLEALNDKLKQNQSQLIQSEKMASLGQLAAGVAHEINNPVGFITSNLGTLEEYNNAFKDILSNYKLLESGIDSSDGVAVNLAREKIRLIWQKEDIDFVLDDVKQLIQESRDGAVRVKDIVQNLKSFARLDEDERKLASINEGIEATLRIVWNELKYKCEVVKELGEIPEIFCNPGQLNQVFMNLFVNASHAFEKQGTIRVTTYEQDGSVVIKVSDNGCGIAPENLNKLFDPFFTTKAVGVGTGLGLSISHGIVTDHNGTISVESEVGVGTTFTVIIPVVAEA